MKYNLTENQKETARAIVKAVRDGKIGETFQIMIHPDHLSLGRIHGFQGWTTCPGDAGALLLLEQARLLLMNVKRGTIAEGTITGSLLNAVDTNFRDEEESAPVSTIAQPHPTEISLSIDRLRQKYPDAKKLGFLIMRFTAAKPFERIVRTIKDTASTHGLHVVRADEHEFHSDLWGNVRTHLHGCGFGIAVYERIDTDEPNANVGLEVGYLMAMNKPVLLLKDKTMDTTQTDLAGKLYKSFDPHDPEGTVPPVLERWLSDYGITVESSTSRLLTS